MDEGPGAVADEAGCVGLLRSATVAIRAVASGGRDESLGTGFFVAPRLVATCAHVVARTVDELPERLAGRMPGTGTDLALIPAAERYFRDADGLDLAILEVADGPEHDFVLMSGALAVGDPLFVYGHPDGAFRAGQSTLLTHQGASRRAEGGPVELPRGYGTPIRGGYSGSGVINLRTGAVCGMVSTSDHAGSAHLVPVTAILARCEQAKALHDGPAFVHRKWLQALGDDQVDAGGWRFPGPRLRDYLRYAGLAAEQHPYREAAGSVNGAAPPLSAVYVYPLAERAGPVEAGDGRTALPADEIFEQDGDVLLVGEAGAGKSSLLRAAANASVSRWRRDDADRVVPVRIRATDLVGPRTLPEAIAAGANLNLGGVGAHRTWPPSFFATAPTPGATWLVLVDGLDEVMDARHRQAVIDKIVGFRAQSRESHRMVVATRPLSDLGAQLPPHWDLDAFRLSLFTDDQLTEFVERWLVYLGLPDATSAAREFTRRLAGSAMAGLARNPMLAMMLCRLYAGDPRAPLPTSSVELYERFVSLLVARLYRTDGAVRQQINGFTFPYGRRAEAAGDELLDRLPGDIRRVAYARRRDPTVPVLQTVARWSEPIRPDHVPHDAWNDLLRAMLRGSGILVEHEHEFDFIHHTVAEFAAARFVGTDPRLARRVFRELFPRTILGNWTAARDLWRHPYARFLVSGWSRDRKLTAGLLRALRRADLDACRFVATLTREGVPVDPAVSRAAVEIAVAASTAGRGPERRRLAISAVLVLDGAVGSDLLYGLARNRDADVESRYWAIEALGELADPHAKVVNLLRQGTGLAGVRWALYAIATRFGSSAADLLETLAGDESLRVVDRRRAAEALGVQDPARRDAILADLSALGEPAADFGTATAPFGRRVRARLARFNPPWQASGAEPPLVRLLSAHRKTNPHGDFDLLRRAFDRAGEAHEGQYRRSGDPYITHPLAVAAILAELGMDSSTLAAALLHDTVDEDAGHTLGDLRREFGGEVAGLIERLADLDTFRPGDGSRVDLLRRFLARVDDPRVLVMKLADRLHNMRTVSFLPREMQEQKATETLEVLAPLADRLGMHTIKWELEDLAFGTLFPKRYEEIHRLVEEHAPQREALLRQVTRRIGEDLRTAKIKAEVGGRPKHLYSVYRKMIERGREFADIYDLVGVRILVDSEHDCYAALGVVHACWQPVPGRFKDYILLPKVNRYRSLHTTVIGPAGRPLEVQIRSYAMHRTAEYGIVASLRDGDGFGEYWRSDPSDEAMSDGDVVRPVLGDGATDRGESPAESSAELERVGYTSIVFELVRRHRRIADAALLARMAGLLGYSDWSDLLVALGSRAVQPDAVADRLIALVDSGAVSADRAR